MSCSDVGREGVLPISLLMNINVCMMHSCVCVSLLLLPASVYHLFSQSYDLSLQASLPNTAKLHTAVYVSVCVCVCVCVCV